MCDDEVEEDFEEVERIKIQDAILKTEIKNRATHS